MSPAHPIELAAPVTAADRILGPDDARVTIVEYADFECPSCKQAVPVVKLILERFAEDVRFVYRHFPLEDAHPHALSAAIAAESAGAQDRFWQMHALLFENQQALLPADLHRYALELGLDLARFRLAMTEERVLARIRQDIEGGRRSCVRSTPAFFINGVIQDVSFGLYLLEQGVEAALRR